MRKLQVLNDTNSIEPARHYRRKSDGDIKQPIPSKKVVRSMSEPPRKRLSESQIDLNKENWDPVKQLYSNEPKPIKKRSIFRRKPLADITKSYLKDRGLVSFSSTTNVDSRIIFSAEVDGKDAFKFTDKAVTKSSRFKLEIKKPSPSILKKHFNHANVLAAGEVTKEKAENGRFKLKAKSTGLGEMDSVAVNTFDIIKSDPDAKAAELKTLNVKKLVKSKDVKTVSDKLQHVP